MDPPSCAGRADRGSAVRGFRARRGVGPSGRSCWLGRLDRLDHLRRRPRPGNRLGRLRTPTAPSRRGRRRRAAGPSPTHRERRTDATGHDAGGHGGHGGSRPPRPRSAVRPAPGHLDRSRVGRRAIRRRDHAPLGPPAGGGRPQVHDRRIDRARHSVDRCGSPPGARTRRGPARRPGRPLTSHLVDLAVDVVAARVCSGPRLARAVVGGPRRSVRASGGPARRRAARHAVSGAGCWRPRLAAAAGRAGRSGRAGRGWTIRRGVLLGIACGAAPDDGFRHPGDRAGALGGGDRHGTGGGRRGVGRSREPPARRPRAGYRIAACRDRGGLLRRLVAERHRRDRRRTVWRPAQRGHAAPCARRGTWDTVRSPRRAGGRRRSPARHRPSERGSPLP